MEFSFLTTDVDDLQCPGCAQDKDGITGSKRNFSYIYRPDVVGTTVPPLAVAKCSNCGFISLEIDCNTKMQNIERHQLEVSVLF